MDQEPRYLRSAVDQGVVVLTIIEPKVQGEEVAEALRGEMLAAVAASGLRKVVVDMHFVKYISSAAFRPLLHLRRTLQDEGGQMVLCGLSPVVGNIFHVTRMIGPGGTPSALFEIETDVPSAVARLQRAPTGT